MSGEELIGLLGSSDLNTFNQSVQQSDPYSMAGKGLASWNPDYSTWSPTAVGVSSFAKSFLSGLLQNYGQQRASDQLASVVNVLPQLKSDPYATATPEGVDSGAFNVLRGSAILKKAQSDAQEAQTEKKFNSDLLAKLLGKKAEIVGEDAGYKALGQGGENPNSPAFKATKAIKDEEDAARNEILTATKYPAVSKLQTTSTALSQLKNIKDLNTASSDIPFATLFIGGLDGSVVREGEYARVAGANPFLDKFKNQLEGALNGTSTLGVDIKRQMYNELQKTQKGLAAEAILQTGPRLATAVQRGADPKNILPFDPNMSFEENITTDAPVATGEVTKSGKKVYIVNGVKGTID